LNSEKKKKKENHHQTPNHHTAPPTPRRQGRQGENTIATAHAIVTDDDPHKQD
jgi:hypothetical protein